MSNLGKPLTLGDLTMKNRVVLAPLTRARSEGRIPNEWNAKYYEQRAGSGLIITEATGISPQGDGWRDAPGIYTAEQVAGWKKVTDAVHAKGGLIFLQLWHMGRQSDSSYQPNNAQIVAPSAIPCNGDVHAADGSKHPYELPRALETEEIPGIVQDYKKAAANAKEAGFDGVEIHAANGYLIDQFLQKISNHREDKYGGSRENRYRFLGEIVEAVKEVWPANRIGVRLGPNGNFGTMGHEENAELFPWVASQLKPHGLAYLSLIDGLAFGAHGLCREVTLFEMKVAFGGVTFGNCGYDRAAGDTAVRTGVADAIVYGRLYISNPDLAERFINDWPLNPDAKYEHYYLGGYGKDGHVGYIDYPFYNPEEVKV